MKNITKMMKMRCIVCEKPTIISYRLQDIEAAFCCEHLPKDRPLMKIEVRI